MLNTFNKTSNAFLTNFKVLPKTGYIKMKQTNRKKLTWTNRIVIQTRKTRKISIAAVENVKILEIEFYFVFPLKKIKQ